MQKGRSFGSSPPTETIYGTMEVEGRKSAHELWTPRPSNMRLDLGLDDPETADRDLNLDWIAPDPITRMCFRARKAVGFSIDLEKIRVDGDTAYLSFEYTLIYDRRYSSPWDSRAMREWPEPEGGYAERSPRLPVRHARLWSWRPRPEGATLQNMNTEPFIDWLVEHDLNLRFQVCDEVLSEGLRRGNEVGLYISNEQVGLFEADVTLDFDYVIVPGKGLDPFTLDLSDYPTEEEYKALREEFPDEHVGNWSDHFPIFSIPFPPLDNGFESYGLPGASGVPGSRPLDGMDYKTEGYSKFLSKHRLL